MAGLLRVNVSVYVDQRPIEPMSGGAEGGRSPYVPPPLPEIPLLS